MQCKNYRPRMRRMAATAKPLSTVNSRYTPLSCHPYCLYFYSSIFSISGAVMIESNVVIMIA